MEQVHFWVGSKNWGLKHGGIFHISMHTVRRGSALPKSCRDRVCLFRTFKSLENQMRLVRAEEKKIRALYSVMGYKEMNP